MANYEYQYEYTVGRIISTEYTSTDIHIETNIYTTTT